MARSKTNYRPVIGEPTDRLARLLDLDPQTRSEVAARLGRLTEEERELADAVRVNIIAGLGAFLTERTEHPEQHLISATTSDAAWVAGVLAAGEPVADWMAARGVGEPVIAATLGDVGRHLRLHRAHTGAVGFDAPFWMVAVLAGSLYQLGRLQFDLRRLRPGEPVPPTATGDWLLDVHIPAAGPLTPSAVGDAFERATSFFSALLPDQPVRVAVCASWLLDPHLGRTLPADSNIATFQRLFTAYGEPRDDELDAVYFTFGQRSLAELDRLPRDTALQRVVLDRLAAGDHWSVVRGYRPLPIPHS